MGMNLVDQLSPKQEQAIIALLAQPTVLRAAEATGVAESTMHRWLDEPGFAAAYRAARRKAFSQAIAITSRYAPLAVQVLGKIMSDEKAPHSARVQAATAVLKFSRESIELDDLAARIEALERGPGASARAGPGSEAA